MSINRNCCLRCFAIWFALLAAGSHVRSQEPSPTVPNGRETLRNRVGQSELADEEKAKILEVIDQAESQAAEAQARRVADASNQAAMAELPNRVESATADLQSLRAFEPEPSPNQDLAELEARLTALEGQLSTAKEGLVETDTAVAAASQRRAEIESELPKLEKQLAERRAQIETAKANTAPTLMAEATLAELTASESLLQATIAAMKSELALIDAESAAGLRQLLRDAQARRVETISQQETLVKREVEIARAKDAADRVESAEKQLADLHKALVPIGEQNRELAGRNQQLAEKILDVQAQLARRKLRLEELEAAFNQAKRMVTSVGRTDAVGALLRNLKQSLPSISAYRLRDRERQPLINDAQYDLIELTDRRNAKLELTVAALLRSAGRSVPAAQRVELENEARTLLEQQRTDFLDPAIKNQTIYFNTLVSLSTTEQKIIQLIEEATDYANERILWIRSSKPLLSQLIPSEDEWWFLIPAAWSNLPEKLGTDLKSQFGLWVAAIVILFLLIRFGAILRRDIRKIGEEATRTSNTKFAPTVQSFLLTIATSLPTPLALSFVGWRLGINAGSDQVTLALAHAAQTAAIVFFPMNLLRQVCRSSGLAMSHFGWPQNLVHDLRRALRWFLALILPLVLVISFLNAGTSVFGYDTLERYFYLLAMAVFCVFTANLAHPGRGLPGYYLQHAADGWVQRLEYVWYPLLVLVPVGLALLAALGYYFTSQQLAWRIFQSLVLLIAIVLIMSLVMRWVLLQRRKLRMQQAQTRHQESSAEVPETPIPLPEESPPDVQLQMQQTHRLLHTFAVAMLLVGLWVIWDDVRPAFDFFEEWPIWHSTTTVTETVPSETGTPLTRTREVPEAITIADVVFGLIVMMLTVVATRNIPGLLEFAILSRLPLDKSARYAITALVSYVIILLGLILAGRIIGLHWQQIQWMATALTFGLAFGLQEIFANFVAGIIILFERPVRVGDVVELDGVTGVVTQIRIRATTITNWDKKDFIVPNKEFITGKVLNWTLSDQVTRLVITVGIAYGSDTQRATQILERVIKENPDVLEEPKPKITFDMFADSSLNFTIRAFVGAMDKRLPVTHQLHTAIDDAFRVAGIQIAFPQRDLHLRSVPESIAADQHEVGDAWLRRGPPDQTRDGNSESAE